jgi:hypothetical protein
MLSLVTLVTAIPLKPEVHKLIGAEFTGGTLPYCVDQTLCPGAPNTCEEYFNIKHFETGCASGCPPEVLDVLRATISVLPPVCPFPPPCVDLNQCPDEPKTCEELEYNLVSGCAATCSQPEKKGLEDLIEYTLGRRCMLIVPDTSWGGDHHEPEAPPEPAPVPGEPKQGEMPPCLDLSQCTRMPESCKELQDNLDHGCARTCGDWAKAKLTDFVETALGVKCDKPTPVPASSPAPHWTPPLASPEPKPYVFAAPKESPAPLTAPTPVVSPAPKAPNNTDDEFINLPKCVDLWACPTAPHTCEQMQHNLVAGCAKNCDDESKGYLAHLFERHTGQVCAPGGEGSTPTGDGAIQAAKFCTETCPVIYQLCADVAMIHMCRSTCSVAGCVDNCKDGEPICKPDAICAITKATCTDHHLISDCISMCSSAKKKHQ